MKIIDNQIVDNFSEAIRTAERRLRTESMVTLCSTDYKEHMAMYLAWRQVGGCVFVKAPGLPPAQDHHVTQLVQGINVSDSVLFHTSGTTGVPKLVVNTFQHFDQAVLMSTQALQWSTGVNFLCFVPAFTTGFWHIIMPATCFHNSTLTVGHKEKAIHDINTSDANMAILVPGLVNFLRSQGANLQLYNYNTIGIGASQVLKNHTDWILAQGADSVTHLYGASEISSPLLSRRTEHVDDFSEWLNIEPHGDNKIKFQDGELLVSGASVCSNYQDFDHTGRWLHTGDLWEENANMIKFAGRTNDIVKINGFKTNLLHIENTIEAQTNLGDCLAVPKHTNGADWIELLYTNRTFDLNRSELEDRLGHFLSRCNIPKKYSLVDQIPRNALGKKVRHV